MINLSTPKKYRDLKTLGDKLYHFLCLRVFNLIIILIFISVPGILFSQTEASNTGSPVLAGIREKLKGGTVFKAEFNHWSADTFTGDTTRYHGNIWITNNRYKVEANKRLLVVSDSISQVHDRNRNRIIISEYDPNEDEFAAARLLYRTPEQYQISQKQEQGNIIVLLEANDPFSYFRTIKLKVASQSLLPQHVKAVDQTDNVLTTSFSSGQYITNAPDGLFDFEYPDDAEVIDLRKE